VTSDPRVLGVETEYGISVIGDPAANPMTSSSQVVNAYAAVHARTRRVRWDYEEESPLRDARGFERAREEASADLLTDEDFGMANAVLTNGARLYVDHAHPEYATPEVTNARDAVVWDKAGEHVMAEAARLAQTCYGVPLALFKNNTDSKGASYGTHENYLMSRATPFGDIVSALTAFLVSRQVVCGAGRVGIGQDSSSTGYQLSSRADFFEVPVGLETTLKRPIINTRDEPHADSTKHRRLHVIIGDANLSEVATFVKVGSTSLVLDLIEAGLLRDAPVLADPVAALHAISHDPTLHVRVRLADGELVTGLALQEFYLGRAKQHLDSIDRADDGVLRDVLVRWESLLDRLGEDPRLCAGELDWVAKLAVLEGYMRRDGVTLGHPKLALVDLQYADLRPGRSLYQRLVDRGRIERLVDDAEVTRAVAEPPIDTRAFFRGRCLSRYASDIVAASWDSVVFDIDGRPALQRVPTMDPLRGTQDHVGSLLDASPTATDLLGQLGAG
jgi:proteasome accessory factor PafA2